VSRDMARILAEFGFAKVHCTPHLIRGCFENPPEKVRRAARSLQRVLDAAAIDLQLIPGTEHYLDEYLSENVPGALTVNSSRYLLVEVPFRSGGEMLPAMVEGLHNHGLLPLFAHPERCSVFQPPARAEGVRGALSFVLGRRKEPDLEGTLIAKLRKDGCRFQGNLGSFAGVYGSVVKERALLFLKHGVYSCLGSDAHTPQGLESMLCVGFEAVVTTLGEEAAVRLLTGAEM
jgi:protein-tyrosine phosphatase